jgi:hypothetical protein
MFVISHSQDPLPPRVVLVILILVVAVSIRGLASLVRGH